MFTTKNYWNHNILIVGVFLISLLAPCLFQVLAGSRLVWWRLLHLLERDFGFLHRILKGVGLPIARRDCLTVCVNSTSRGERSLATPAYQGRLALIFLPLGAAVNKIMCYTNTTQRVRKAPRASASHFPLGKGCPTNTQSPCSAHHINV
jgi:hypothetical protein